MASAMHPPAPHDLLPPLLACLPTAFASTRPPPALLPLLSPILRQRVQLLSDASSSSSTTWLTKLSWDPAKAEQLGSIVEGGPFELHPVSNEIEFGDAEIVGYRRLDEETLQSRLDIEDLGLTVIYLWCQTDGAGGGDGWRVTELLPLDQEKKGTTNVWSISIEEAHKAWTRKQVSSPKPNGIPPPPINGTQPDPVASEENDGDTDDDYWAQYDNAPTSTPGPQPSPGPPPSQPPSSKTHARTTSEAEYFSRYSAVQPEMDNDDPSTDRNMIGESSLNGNALTSPLPTNHDTLPAPPIANHLIPPAVDKSIPAPQPQPLPPQNTTTADPRRPTTTSTSSSSTRSSALIDKLEDSAMQQSRTELAVRQHVASTLKSLWRLARGTGMEIGEFGALVGREVEVLGVEEEMEGG
ncbi:MAG: hypothetical protein Q9202_002358 [Teloschistes flavicans]